MAVWRREALRRLPQCKREIEAARSPMAMWLELYFACERALNLRPPDFPIADAIWSHALVSLASPNGDLRTAAAVAFVESIVTCQAARENLHRWLTTSTFADLRHFFAYHLTPTELESLTKDFHAQRAAAGRRAFKAP